jgi:ankyrin repeat protein
VSRWLVENRADVHHISARGWTPAFSLFGSESCHQDSCEEFLELLSAASFSDFNAQDGDGWSIMHRVAAFGTADHIKSLISRKVSLDLRTTNLGWTPIFCAAQFNNLSTFTELIQYQPGLLAATDIRNWTLLHLAVNASSLDIMRVLIGLGADPHALSFPTAFYIPKDLSGLLLTPGDIARIRGPPIFTAYLDALAASGHEVHLVNSDIFWPAFE